MRGSTVDIRAWLAELGLEQYAEAFIANHITASVLDQLTSDDLKELGIQSLGHRKALLAAIAARYGAALDSVAIVSSVAARLEPASRAASPTQGERRQVTVLFADLCGFTALSKTLDPEELHALIGRYTALVDGIVKSYGGTVDKHIGDAVMALFGAPIAHGDDPLRAARAALDIHAAMHDLGTDFDRVLQAHLGIASGEVIAADLGHPDHADYSVLGDSVNLAARLVSVAQPGQTVIADAVQRLLAGRVTCKALGEISVKGLDHAARAWLLQDLVAEPAAGTSFGGTLFVGRHAEIAQVSAIAATCLEQRSGQAVLIRGEAGIGKTRLLAEMTGLCKHLGFLPHRGLVFDFGGGGGQDAIRTVLRSLLQIAPDSAVAQQQDIVAQAIAAGIIADGQGVFLDDLLDLPKPVEMRALYDAMDNAARARGRRDVVMSVVVAMGQRQPILLIFEDLHWADPPVLAAIAAMAVAIRSVPALLLMTTRLDGDPIDAAWQAGLAGTPLTRLTLGPLLEAEALALAGGFIDASQRIAQSCVKRAEGNPLFLEQLLHNAEEGSDEQIPGSIQSLVLARLDRLTARDKRAAQVAAVIGQHFDLADLRALLEEPGYDCAGLIEHAVVRPDGGGYLFAHALVQQGVYSSLLRAHRRGLHQRAAQMLAASDPVLRAQHLDRAEDPAAAAAYAEAAGILRAGYRFDQAMSMVERGLEVARDAVDVYALTYLLGDILNDLGDIPAATLAFRRAVELAPDDLGRCRGWISIAMLLRVTEEFSEALGLLDQAEAVATAKTEIAELARLHHLRGNIYFLQARIAECQAEHELGLQHAQHAQSTEAEARSLGGLGDAAYAQGRMRSACEYFTRCVDLSRQHGFGRIEVANRSMIGFSRLYLDEAAEALADGLAAVEAAARVGHVRAELLGETMCVMAGIELGDFDVASQHLPRSEELAIRLNALRFMAQNLEFAGRILQGQGQREAAVAMLHRSLSLCRQVGMNFCGPKVCSILAVLTEDAAERRALLVEGETLLQAGAVGHNHLWFHRDAMAAMACARDWAGALAYADALERYTSAEPLPWSDALIERVRSTATMALSAF
jgi:class 3 adenylate cyclase/tetratricopeptide (TPR) repeat protein